MVVILILLYISVEQSHLVPSLIVRYRPRSCVSNAPDLNSTYAPQKVLKGEVHLSHKIKDNRNNSSQVKGTAFKDTQIG